LWQSNDYNGQISIKVGGNSLLNLVLPDMHPINKKILEDQQHTDFSLIAKNGAEIRCHKNFISGKLSFVYR